MTTPDVEPPAGPEASGSAVPLPYGDTRHQAAHQFLVEEAHLLDTGRFEAWLTLLHPEIRYRMPVRVTTSRSQAVPVLGSMDHLDEDLHSLTKRVQRLASDTAWTEDPPSRLRHLVTNVRTFVMDQNPGDEGPLAVESYVQLFRSRLDTRPADLISAGRRDVLMPSGNGDGWLLVERLVEVDEAVLRTQNLAVFL